MTTEEAITGIKTWIGSMKCAHKDDDCANEFIDCAWYLAKKQIPKIPRTYLAFDGVKRKGCPSCIENEILYAGQKYCSVCGQAIKWENAND